MTDYNQKHDETVNLILSANYGLFSLSFLDPREFQSKHFVSACNISDVPRKFPYAVEPISKESVDHLIRAHYLGKWPGVVTCIVGLRHHSDYIGTIVFALPPREICKRYSVSVAWELARLFITDTTPKNAETWFMSRAIAHVKKAHKDVELLVSYADPSKGHKGTIYRAGNWISDGKTDSERKSPRCDLMGPDGTIYSRWSHAPAGSIRVPRTQKLRFIYWMDGHEKRRSLKWNRK